MSRWPYRRYPAGWVDRHVGIIVNGIDGSGRIRPGSAAVRRFIDAGAGRPSAADRGIGGIGIRGIDGNLCHVMRVKTPAGFPASSFARHPWI